MNPYTSEAYAYRLLKKCYKAINPNTNPDLIREVAAYLAAPIPDEPPGVREDVASPPARGQP